MVINEIIKRGVHKHLKKLNKNQSWLARETGIKANEISDFFNGKKNFSEKRIVKLIAPLGVDLNQIIRNGLNDAFVPNDSIYEKRIRELEANNKKLIETLHSITTEKK